MIYVKYVNNKCYGRGRNRTQGERGMRGVGRGAGGGIPLSPEFYFYLCRSIYCSHISHIYWIFYISKCSKIYFPYFSLFVSHICNFFTKKRPLRACGRTKKIICQNMNETPCNFFTFPCNFSILLPWFFLYFPNIFNKIKKCLNRLVRRAMETLSTSFCSIFSGGSF